MENGSKIPFYQKKNEYRKAGIGMLLSALLAVAAYFFNQWNMQTLINDRTESGFSLFSILATALKNMFPRLAHLAIGENRSFVFSFSTMIYILISVIYFLAIFELLRLAYLDALQGKTVLEKTYRRDKYLIWRGGVFLALLLAFVALTCMPQYRGNHNDMQGMYQSWSQVIDSAREQKLPGYMQMSCTLHRGFGFYCWILSLILAFLSIIYIFVLDTLNEVEMQREKMAKSSKKAGYDF